MMRKAQLTHFPQVSISLFMQLKRSPAMRPLLDYKAPRPPTRTHSHKEESPPLVAAAFYCSS